MMNTIDKLSTQFPSFWNKHLVNETEFKSLLNAYSYVYGNALQKLKELNNEQSPLTIDPYITEYYKAINLKETYTPSNTNYFQPNTLFYKMPEGTFKIEKISKSLDFSDNVYIYGLYKDINTNTVFIAIPSASLSYNDDFLYIDKYYIDNKNVINTYGSLFPNLEVLTGIYLPDPFNYDAIQTIESNMIQKELINIKAQIICLLRCAANGGSLDSLNSLFAVAIDKANFFEQEATVIGYTSLNNIDDENNYGGYAILKVGDTVIDGSFRIKKKLRKIGAILDPYEPYEDPQPNTIKMYSWITNPSRFTQALLCNSEYLLGLLLQLQTTSTSSENPNILRFNNTDNKFDNHIKYDFGKYICTEQVFRNLLRSYGFGYIPVQSVSGSEMYNFTSWILPPLHNRIYEMFKNVIVVELQRQGGCCSSRRTSTNRMLAKIDPTQWILKVLEYFRPLHCKYVLTNQKSSTPGN